MATRNAICAYLQACSPESSLLHSYLVFALCSPHQHVNPLHTSVTGGGQQMVLPITVASDLRYRDAVSLHGGVGETSAWCDVGLMAAEPWERWQCHECIRTASVSASAHQSLAVAWAHPRPSRVIAARKAEARGRQGGVR